MVFYIELYLYGIVYSFNSSILS